MVGALGGAAGAGGCSARSFGHRHFAVADALGVSGLFTDLMLAMGNGLPNVYWIVHMNQGSKSHVASGRWMCCECWSET